MRNQKGLGQFILDALDNNKDKSLSPKELEKMVLGAGYQTKSNSFITCIHSTLWNLAKQGTVQKSNGLYSLATDYAHVHVPYTPKNRLVLDTEDSTDPTDRVVSIIKKVGQMIRECGSANNLKMIIDAMDN